MTKLPTYALFVNVFTPIVLLSVFSLQAGCGGAPAPTKTSKAVQLVAREDKEGFDINGDQKNDVLRYFEVTGDQRVLKKKTFDFNFDGRVDFIRFYTDKGEIDRDEMDMDFNGEFDLFSIYKGGVMIRQEVSLRGDQAPEVIKIFRSGDLKHIMYDRDSDNNFEYWEYFRDDQLIATGLDTDLDGVPDERSEVKSE